MVFCLKSDHARADLSKNVEWIFSDPIKQGVRGRSPGKKPDYSIINFLEDLSI